MKGNEPEISSQLPAHVIQRNLKISDWILFAVGVVLLAGGMMFLGPVKLAFVMIFLVLVCIAFFSPKYGLYILFGAETAYVLVIYINLMAIAPSMIGLDYTISYVIDDRGLLVVPLVVLFVSYLMGFLSREWICVKQRPITKFEGVLIAFLLFAVAWVSLAIANENFPLIIVSDLHVVMIFAFGIFAARSFNSALEFRTLFNFLIVISLLQWIFLIGFFFQQHLYTQLLFLMTLLRSIQGSSDIYSPYIPLMLAIISIKYPQKKSGLEKHYPLLIFLFTIRTILSLSRGAMLQVMIGVIVLYFFLPKENRVVYFQQIKKQMVYAVIFCLAMFMVNPNMAKIGFMLVASRTTEGERNVNNSVARGSMKYRALETDMVMENVIESPLFGFGPGKQTKKRMFTYVSAAEEPYVHNGYLWYILKFGILGLLFLFYVMLRYLVSFKERIRGSPPLMKAMLAGTSAAFIGIIPIVLTNSVIAAVQGVIFVGFIFGVLIFSELANPTAELNDGEIKIANS
ncbi:MAG: O-antigen ligase family protein [bacterium]